MSLPRGTSLLKTGSLQKLPSTYLNDEDDEIFEEVENQLDLNFPERSEDDYGLSETDSFVSCSSAELASESDGFEEETQIDRNVKVVKIENANRNIEITDKTKQKIPESEYYSSYTNDTEYDALDTDVPAYNPSFELVTQLASRNAYEESLLSDFNNDEGTSSSTYREK